MESPVSFSAQEDQNIIEEFFILGVETVEQVKSEPFSFILRYFSDFFKNKQGIQSWYRGEILVSFPSSPKQLKIKPHVKNYLLSIIQTEYISVWFRNTRREEAKLISSPIAD